MIVTVIMTGGRGERFWPVSRSNRPKQFLSLTGGPTLFQEAVRRVIPLTPADAIFPVSGRDYLHFLREQASAIPEKNYVIEPVGRDTAACLALAGFTLRRKYPGLDPVMLVLAADHVIAAEERFRDILCAGAEVAAGEDCAVVLGILPVYPATGYGYIHYEREPSDQCLGIPIHNALGFVEKPKPDIAEKYLAAGDYLWNSGMFIWRLSYFLQLLAQYLPNHYEKFDRIFAGQNEPNLDELNAIFKDLDRISVDYGIMEKADNVYVMCTDIGWSDLGTWSSLYEHSAVDKRSNVLVRGEVFSYDNKGNIFNITPGKVAVLQGLKDYIVVDSDDVLLIVKKEEEQNIKQYLEDVKKSSKDKFM